MHEIIPKLTAKFSAATPSNADNAEHPEKFTPSAGKITAFHTPGGTGIRVDTAAYAEGVIPPYYDSLIAKLIATAETGLRPSADARALEMFIVEGIHTTIPLHRGSWPIRTSWRKLRYQIYGTLSGQVE